MSLIMLRINYISICYPNDVWSFNNHESRLIFLLWLQFGPLVEMSEFIEFRSKLVTYSKLHGGQFNVCTSDSRKGPKGIPGFNELTVLFTCTVSMSCATMVCVTCLSMFWIYYSSKKIVMYIVCTNCLSLVWKNCSSTLILMISESPWTYYQRVVYLVWMDLGWNQPWIF